MGTTRRQQRHHTTISPPGPRIGPNRHKRNELRHESNRQERGVPPPLDYPPAVGSVAGLLVYYWFFSGDTGWFSCVMCVCAVWFCCCVVLYVLVCKLGGGVVMWLGWTNLGLGWRLGAVCRHCGRAHLCLGFAARCAARDVSGWGWRDRGSWLSGRPDPLGGGGLAGDRAYADWLEYGRVHGW